MGLVVSPFTFKRRFGNDLFLYCEGGEDMTKLQLISGVVYTNLQPWEVRQYLAGGSKGGCIDGFSDQAGTIKIFINVSSIEYIYE